METPGKWLEKALVDLCLKIETGLSMGLDKDMISFLVSYCELADPRDAKEYLDNNNWPGDRENRNQVNPKKEKAGKFVSLAEAAKGSIVFLQGKPCSFQACRHNLVSNCLSCGKIVCEQEGEGPCNFCGALVLREGSAYAGLDEGLPPLSDTEEAAEAYAKRLFDYDRNSAAQTTVIDDQSDYYEMEGEQVDVKGGKGTFGEETRGD
ncbi:Activating signal cointegrator 1 [Quillaja saponaria]|uniref:Activating signal cointegrator 1 n=1 Tax=Quillaja saponaria TaxID=32244 RepID=A0AAD7QBE6_QUISA|nr:Activating signal cointegrator 1 [Quillaja saponaria]